MNQRSKTLSRRGLLRGLGGALISLPFLEALQPSRARADVAKAPKRFIVMYTSNGTVMKNWKPSSTGADFTVSPILKPLDTPILRPHLSVLSGIQMSSALDVGGNGHSVGMTNMLTGRVFKEVVGTEFGDVGWGGGISIDQELAKRVKAEGQLPSIELGVQSQKQYQNFYSYISYGEGGGSANAVASDDDPRSAYVRLFANVPDAQQTKAELEKLQAQRKGVLDFVQEDFKRLHDKLGGSDQQRLDKHLALLEDLESRIGIGAVCEKPGMPVLDDSDINSTSRFPDIAKMQMDLLAVALSCDITRVGTLQFSTAQSGTVFSDWIDTNWSDLSETYHHGISHAAAASSVTNPTAQEQSAIDKLTLINTWFAEQLAYLGGRLAEMEDADGSSVLDNTAILWVSEVSEGPSHKFTNMPYVLLGGMGGALKKGEHFDFDNQRSHNDLFVTLGQAMDQTDLTTFGDEKYCSGPIADLLA